MELQHNVVTDLPLDHVRRDPQQPRTEFEPAELEALAADLRARGVDHPILVQPDPAATGGYVIKDGERRWRAAQLAGLATIPCLLAKSIPEDGAAVERLLDQVADNQHAEKLGPLDLARFLSRLVEEHGIAVKDVPALLAQRGLSMSRPYVSNLMRLLELPEWAQQMVKSGRLTAAHGKHLLTANDSPAVLAELKTRIEKWDESMDGALTVEEMPDQVFLAFDEKHISLSATFGAKAPKFDVKTCSGCPNRKQVKGRWRSGDFCLDPPCFQQKQDAAIAKEKPRAVAGTNNAKGASAAEREKTQRAEHDAALKHQASELADRRAVTQILAAVGRETKLTADDLRHAILSNLQAIEYDVDDDFLQLLCEHFRVKRRGGYHEALVNEVKKCSDLSRLQAYLVGVRVLESTTRFVNQETLENVAKHFKVDVARLQREALAELKAAEKPKPGAADKAGKPAAAPAAKKPAPKKK